MDFARARLPGTHGAQQLRPGASRCQDLALLAAAIARGGAAIHDGRRPYVPNGRGAVPVCRPISRNLRPSHVPVGVP